MRQAITLSHLCLHCLPPILPQLFRGGQFSSVFFGTRKFEGIITHSSSNGTWQGNDEIGTIPDFRKGQLFPWTVSRGGEKDQNGMIGDGRKSGTGRCKHHR